VATTTRPTDPSASSLVPRVQRDVEAGAADLQLKVALAAVGTTLFVIRMLGSGWSSGYTISFPDSSSFLHVARLGPFSLHFWFGERPIMTPMLLWLVGRNIRLAVLAQTAIYLAVAWWTVVSLRSIARSTVARGVGTLLVLAVFVRGPFAFWSTDILSESLNISFGIATITGWLLAVDRRRTRDVKIAWACTWAWLLTRDSNVMLTVVFIVVPALAASRWWRAATPEVRRRMRTGAIVSVLLCAYIVVAQGVSHRNQTPALDVIGQQVLPDHELTAFYVSWGMPLDDAVRERTGRNSFDDSSKMLTEPALAPLRDWARGRGQTVQLASMVRFAPKFVPALWRKIGDVVGTTNDGYDLFGVNHRLPTSFTFGLGGPTTQHQLEVWLGITVAALIGLASSRRHRRHAFALTLALLAAGADVYVGWFGDSLERQRHSVGGVPRVAVLIAIVITLIVDELVDPNGGRARDVELEPATAVSVTIESEADA
jgi:hypothetical protein